MTARKRVRSKKAAAARRSVRAPRPRPAPPRPAAVLRPVRVLPRQNPAGNVDVTGARRIVGMGWHPDVPDRRDFDNQTSEIQAQLRRIGSRYIGTKNKLPAQVDNRSACPPIEDQGALGSCTAHAVIGLMEYLQRRSRRKHVDLSRAFLYKVTRRLLGWTGDTGAFIRTAIKAAAVFGVPPEDQWAYDIARFDEEPEAFLYAYAASFNALNYTRLDRYGLSGDETLDEVKRALAAGFPVALGFPVYSSLSDDADIPYPDPTTDRLLGGHAVMAAGYDDARTIAGTRGALLIRNSWGVDWGESGYGWLPYAYVEEQLAEDFWSIFKQEWIDVSKFD